jgi:hypothetical protein
VHLDLAYIDPGSGSLIIQAVIATLVAIPFFFRTHFARLARTFRNRSAGDAVDSNAQDRHTSS